MEEMYYVVNTMVLKENKTPAQNIFVYADKTEAYSVYHQTLASNYASDKISQFCVLLFTSTNMILSSEVWYSEPIVI